MQGERKTYEGTRWRIELGAYEGLRRFAVDELVRTLGRYLPYVVEAVSGCDAQSASGATDAHRLVVGRADEPHLKRWIETGLLPAPARAQGYSIKVCDAPGAAAKDAGPRRIAVIAGFDDAGMLHGVEAFCAHAVALGIGEEKPELLRRAFDAMADFAECSAPAVTGRGLWLWGYTIHDYRRFFDNMARMRMNLVTLWHDRPPINARDVIDYAHSRGVKVLMGFHWGWGIEGVDLHRPADRQRIVEHVLATYERDYAHLPADGIYFQTSTEHHSLEEGGESTATAACKLVNQTARALYERHGDLYIQFGLHATSIRERYTDLRELDPRVVICWEDAGGVPYTYSATQGSSPQEMEAALEYSRELATFRPGTEFALVPKGWTALRWGDEFENHGPFVLGVHDRPFTAERLRRRQRTWQTANAAWLAVYPAAAKFYREVLAAGPAGVTATGLVEDGVLEEAIQPSVALFAETLWDPHAPDAAILRRALSPYYEIPA